MYISSVIDTMHVNTHSSILYLVGGENTRAGGPTSNLHTQDTNPKPTQEVDYIGIGISFCLVFSPRQFETTYLQEI